MTTAELSGVTGAATPLAAPAQVVQLHPRTRPAWLFVVCLATAAYLTVELGFNARLLDVVGGGATNEEIDRIEVWGRMISGFAAALVLWPRWIKTATVRGASLAGYAWKLTWCSAVAIVAMYAGQETLLRWLVDKSSERQLRDAQHLVLLQSGLVNKVAIVDSLDLTPERLLTAEGKATLALLPILASHMDDVGDRFTSEQRAEVAANIARSRMGEFEERKTHYDELRQALDAIYYPFERARSRKTHRLWGPINNVVPISAGRELPRTYDAFIAEPVYQAAMLRKLGYTCIETANFKVAKPADIKRELWDREIDCIAQRQMDQDGDPEAGRTARRALLVPFMALAFSLMGALAHLAKFSLYLLTVVVGYPLFRRGWIFGAVTLVLPALLLTGFAWLMSSQTTASPAFQGLARDAGFTMRTVIRGTIHGQMFGYPVFEAVRVKALKGFNFGYEGDSE